MKKIISLVFLLTLASFSSLAGASVIAELKAEKIPALLNQKIANLRLYATDPQGQLLPIPFQVDEKYLDSDSGEWRFVLDKQNKDNNPLHAGNGLFDSQDVLIWMDKDAGPPVDPTKLPAAKMRWQIASAAGDGRVVYLSLEDSPSLLSTRQYVNYQEAADQVKTEDYSVGFSKKQPLVQDILVLSPSSGSQDILDRFKVRFKLAIKNFFDFKIDEEGVEGGLVGYKIGPIRLIRRLSAYKSIGPIRVVPKTLTDFVFYEDWVEIPTLINNPLDGPKFLEDKTQGLSGFDFNKNAQGSTVYSDSLNQGIVLQGDVKEVRSPTATQWWAIQTSSGAMVVGIRNDKKLADLQINPM